MIEFTKTDKGFIAAFSDNELYLPNGTISLPSNALSLTIDKADIATFKKASNGDVLFSGLIENITFDGDSVTKQTIGAKFSDTCLSPIGGGTDIEQRVEALEDTVGDSTSGLVKDVDDLETTVGNSSAGLVHDVNGLNSAVADIGLDVEDVKEDVDVLQTTVGDSTSGLIKEVADLFTEVDENGRVTSEALTALRKIILDNERTTSEALTELRKMISDTNDVVDGIDDRLAQAEADITTLDTVMSAAVNQLS